MDFVFLIIVVIILNAILLLPAILLYNWLYKWLKAQSYFFLAKSTLTLIIIYILALVAITVQVLHTSDSDMRNEFYNFTEIKFPETAKFSYKNETTGGLQGENDVDFIATISSIEFKELKDSITSKGYSCNSTITNNVVTYTKDTIIEKKNIDCHIMYIRNYSPGQDYIINIYFLEDKRTIYFWGSRM